MAKLAIKGGKPIRNAKTDPWPKWPVWSEAEKNNLARVLDSGAWSYNGPMETAFNEKWAKWNGVKHALSVANGTVSLQLALEALDIGYGDEVIVPGLTWQATAAAVVDVNAVPVLVDVEPDSWCLDPVKTEAAITKNTRAVIPVHLYGTVADMDAIKKLAKKHELAVIEDCAHQHGSTWKGKKVGSIGDIGSFSFQLSKVLTAGEGGSLTTDSDELFVKLDALRNCGRRPKMKVGNKGAGQYGSEGDLIQSGNYRITDFQAAVLLEQFKRLPAQLKKRDRNARYLNSLLERIPGVTPMIRRPGTELQSYFNFAFRYEPDEFEGLSADKFRKALSAELSAGVESCYIPLNDCPLYRPRTKKRYNLNQRHWRRINPARFKLQNCRRAFTIESVCMHHSVLMGARADAKQIADAVVKIRENAGEL